jgi:hypothetical protein
MNAPKPPKATHLGWARCKIGCTLLFYTGMRAKEAGNFTEEMILELISNKSIIIHQSKISQKRHIIFQILL